MHLPADIGKDMRESDVPATEPFKSKDELRDVHSGRAREQMSDILYPPVMGLFCTGYVLHLAWRTWERRKARKARATFEKFDVATIMLWHCQLDAGALPSKDRQP